MSVESRNVYFKRNEQYIYKNVSLLRSLTIQKPKGCRLFDFRINGVSIHPTEEDSKSATWVIDEVRQRVSNEFENNQMIKLHETFVFQSIQAIPHYIKTPPEEFDRTLFTKDIVIQICPPNNTQLIEYFEGKEEVFESDIRLGNKVQN
jgi:hypothetical protein